MDKSKTRKMIIGQKLRELREKKGLLLRQVAAELEVDTAYISKMERGEKNIKREYIIKLAEIYQTDKDQLLSIWLADMVYDILKEEDLAKQALDLVGKHIELIKKRK